MPPGADIFAIPHWNTVHPDLRARWVSTKPEKLRGHTWDFGTGAYVAYGSQFTSVDDLRDAAKKLGLSDAHVNTTLMRITVGDLMLHYLPRAEAERRTQEQLQAVRDRSNEAIESYLSNEHRGVKPRVFESEEEYEDVRKHATREGNNRVGYRGRSARA